jgi:hypothetical protein
VTPDANTTADSNQPPAGHELLLDGDGIAEAFPHVALDASLWRYYSAATATAPVDLSAIVQGPGIDGPSAALVAAGGPEGIAYFGRAATFELAESVPSRVIPEVGRRLAEELRDVVREAKHSLHVRVVGGSAVLSGFEHVLLNSDSSASLEFSAEVDLTLPEEELWRNLRKSYRSLINTGRRELTIELVDCATPDRDRFEIYRDLHREVAGRVTRPSESWDVMFDLVTAGRGQLVLAHLGDRPVAATYLMRFGRLAIYASGAYVRDLGKFPVSHWPLYASILAARRSGVERLVLGPVFDGPESVSSPKERSIAAFKRGFATAVVAQRTYGIRP